MSSIRVATGSLDSAVYDEAEARALLEQGVLADDALAFREGMSEWLPLGQVLGMVRPQVVVPPVLPVRAETVNAEPVARRQFTKDPTTLTRVVQTMLGSSVVVLLMKIGNNVMLQLETGAVQLKEEVLTGYLAREAFLGWLVLGILVVTAVVFFMWVYRANKNCRGFGAEGMKFTPVGAVTDFFIPILNLVRPHQILSEIWSVSADPVRWKQTGGSGLVTCWWVGLILNGFIQQFWSAGRHVVNTTAELREYLHVCNLMVVMSVVVIIMQSKMVSGIVARQRKWVEGRE
jgi:hypothetical protein